MIKESLFFVSYGCGSTSVCVYSQCQVSGMGCGLCTPPSDSLDLLYEQKVR